MTAVQRIFSAYRRADFADPDGFVVQLGSVLENYPEWVVAEVSHPKTGIQRKIKFSPSIAEIVEGCEAALEPQRRAEAKATEVEKQLKERDEWEAKQRASPVVGRAGRVITWGEYETEFEPKGSKVTGSVYRSGG